MILTPSFAFPNPWAILCHKFLSEASLLVHRKPRGRLLCGARGDGNTEGRGEGRGDSGTRAHSAGACREAAAARLPSASVGRVWLREAGPGHTQGHLLISLLGDQGRLQPGENNRSRTPPQCECPGSQVSPRPRGVLCFRRLKAVFFLVRTTL